MPCRSDYMEPQGKEIASRLVANHLVYLLTALKQPIPENIQKAADDMYGKPSYLEPMVQMLCGMMGALSEEKKAELIYNSRDVRGWSLAIWWDEHQKADEARVAKEQADSQRLENVKSAIAKLTDADLRALGLRRV